MTGYCEGKVPLSLSLRLSNDHTKNVEIEAYIHVKGYAQARVTHLDLESKELNFDNKTKGIGAILIGRDNGFLVILRNPLKQGPYLYKRLYVSGISILKKGEKMGCYLGLKEDGIFLGFKKEGIERLELLAKKLDPSLFDTAQSKLVIE